MDDRIRKALAAACRRLWRAVVTLPDFRGLRFSAAIGGLTLAAMAAVGFAGGLYHLEAPNLAGLPLRLVSVMFIPSLGEEGAFRGLLVPDRAEASRPFVPIAAATAIFTGWHLVETLFLRHAAPIFLRADFLTCAAVLGAGCAVIRWRTSSLWPAVALHWLVVVLWQTWLGGPDVDALK
jgi:predicted Abi (CAAX) family protease